MDLIFQAFWEDIFDQSNRGRREFHIQIKDDGQVVIVRCALFQHGGILQLFPLHTAAFTQQGHDLPSAIEPMESNYIHTKVQFY